VAAWNAVDIDRLVALLTDDAVMTMPPQREFESRARGRSATSSPPSHNREGSTRSLLRQTGTNRQPALAAYAPHDDGTHRPYGLMVVQIDRDKVSGIFGFPDPGLFERCGLAPEPNGRDNEVDSTARSSLE
jgi:hypothetical protein